MQTYAVYLKPKSSCITWPTSDTIFGALCWAIYHLYSRNNHAALENMLAEFEAKPKFILSSAFPCLNKGGIRIRFFPKPLIRDVQGNDIERLAGVKAGPRADKDSLLFKQAVVAVAQKLKALKKISYVSEAIFRQMVEGLLTLEGIYRRIRHCGVIDEDIEKIGNTLITTAERKKIAREQQPEAQWKETDILHNQTDRVTCSAAEGLLFYNEEISFIKPHGQLWFLVKTDDFEFLKPLFRYLEDTGLGGERTAGKGHYKITYDDEPYHLPEAEAPDSFIILSRWFPDESEKNFGKGFSGWNLLNLRPRRETMYSAKAGFISNNLIRMFDQGSIFPLKTRQEYYGRNAPLSFTGAGPVCRDGLALPVFTKMGGC